jgi:hypothetical protein
MKCAVGVVVAFLGATVSTCRADEPLPPSAVAQAEVPKPERHDPVEALIQRVREVERRVRTLSSRWEDIRQGYIRAQQAFMAAEVTYQKAARSNDDASTALSTARVAWDEARWRWELYQLLVLVAAAVDARNLDRFRALTGRTDVGSLDCDGGMSVAAFRALLLARGVDLTGKHIDHIVPLSRGGADHPANYRVIDSQRNLRWGNVWGPGKCHDAGKKCAGAIAISRKCGWYRGPEF